MQFIVLIIEEFKESTKLIQEKNRYKIKAMCSYILKHVNSCVVDV